MVLEVVDRDDSGYIVRWDNPWVKARFRFEDDGQRIRLTGLDMGQGLDSILWSHAMTSGAVLFVGHPHNAYLQAILDMGVIGLALMVAYYWTVWRGFRALGSNAYLSPLMRGFFQGACAALVAFAVSGMTGGSLRPEPENVLLWIAIGIMYGLLARRPAS